MTELTLFTNRCNNAKLMLGLNQVESFNMNNINISENKTTLSSLIDQVNESQQATLITLDEQKQAVLVSLEEWNSLQETLYLLSIPGVKSDLIEGKNTAWEDCIPLEEIEW